MKTTPVTPDDLVASIIALPPIARDPDGGINPGESRKIVDWLASAGVRSFMYGGIANLFNAKLSEYGAVLDLIEAVAPSEDAWMVPAIGGDFGKAIDQVAMLRERDFPTAILLPFWLVQPKGVATGIRKLADAYGKPLMVFFKALDYLTPQDVAALLKDGALCGVEYGIVPDETGQSPHLTALLDLVGSADRLIDGAGELTIVESSKFGIQGYTSGTGLLAPHISQALLEAVKRGDRAAVDSLSQVFVDFDAARAAYSAIPVVHDAIRLAGIADTGPIGPFFESASDPAIVADITRIARELMRANADFRVKEDA
ncbi:dihydrodipicolinate synthase family protein [Kaistia defluvii]|uniref:dihydrodipicolinate synthase family protein n=1 Tax=Kaistia defluvii TaxID=410841 RepID=UPI00225BD896|nr:dihydrodipicolinate synthase family protein [Kaistia defluvii]MCX5518816.1 dihydrodipicolinate synthase family protein [Kaistia defluvii]